MTWNSAVHVMFGVPLLLESIAIFKIPAKTDKDKATQLYQLLYVYYSLIYCVVNVTRQIFCSIFSKQILFDIVCNCYNKASLLFYVHLLFFSLLFFGYLGMWIVSLIFSFLFLLGMKNSSKCFSYTKQTWRNLNTDYCFILKPFE